MRSILCKNNLRITSTSISSWIISVQVLLKKSNQPFGVKMFGYPKHTITLNEQLISFPCLSDGLAFC